MQNCQHRYVAYKGAVMTQLGGVLVQVTPVFILQFFISGLCLNYLFSDKAKKFI